MARVGKRATTEGKFKNNDPVFNQNTKQKKHEINLFRKIN